MIEVSDELVAKAERLLTEGRLTVALPATGPIAVCAGDTGLWSISRDATGQYSCSCPATKLCSHMLALSLVAAPFEEAAPSPLARMEEHRARREQAEAWQEWDPA